MVLGLSAMPSDSYACNTGENHKTGEACGGGGGNVTNPDDFQADCGELFNDGVVGNCNCLFDVNVGIANGNPVMKISLVDDCTTNTMLVLPNFLDPDSSNFPPIFDSCGMVPEPDCPSSDTNTFLDGRDFVLTAVGNPFSGDAVITNSTDHGDIMDIIIAIEASNAGCGPGNLNSAINIDLLNIDSTRKPPIHDPPVHTWINILGTTVRVTDTFPPLCNAIVMQNDPTFARVTIVHDSIVEPLAYTDVGTLFSNLRMDDLGTNTNIGVGSSTIGRPSGASGTAVQFDHVDRGLIDHNTIENEIVEEGPDEGEDVPGTGVLVVDSEEFTIKNNTIKGGDVGIEVGPGADGLITKNTIIGGPNDVGDTVGIVCDGDSSADITIRKNNSVIDYDTLIDC